MGLLTSSILLKEFQKEFRAASKYARVVDRQYEGKFGEQSGDVAKGGTTISVKRPQMVSVRTGRTASFVTPDEGSVSLTVDTMYGVDLKFTDVDLQLSVDDFSNRFIKSAASALAAKIDQKIAADAYKKFALSVGTAGTTPSALKTFNLARGKLVNALVPEDGDLYAFVNTDCSAEIVDALKSLFQNDKEISGQYLNGYMGKAAGMKWMESSHVPVHTVGPLGGTPLVNGANQGIATYADYTDLATDGWTAAAANRLKAGDVVTMAGVYDVDPLTKQNRSYLKQFTVLADVASTAGGAATLRVSPAIIRAGAYQNVNGAPADDAAITVYGAANTVSAQNLVFHPKAITLATVPLILPKGCDMAERTDGGDGISMRLVRDWNNTEAELNTRVDVFFGTQVMMKEWGCRVFG